MDFSAYQTQITELIPLREADNFNALLDDFLWAESNSTKFLIKMEINRLSEPCLRILDLRDKVNEPCHLIQQDKIAHYLTANTTLILEKYITLYGYYCVGVYEAVHQFLAEKKQQQQKIIALQLAKQHQRKLDQCEYLQLTQKNMRHAARMFYVTKLRINNAEGVHFTGHTANISASGLKVKITDHIALATNSKLQVLFSELADEQPDTSLHQPINYQLVKQHQASDGSHYLYLNDSNDNPAFSHFIAEFIRNNQYKYKLDVQYYYQLAKIKALRECALTRMSSLPIYLDASAYHPTLFCLESRENQAILNDWQCDGIDQLPHFFSELRLHRLRADLQVDNSTTLYTFTHTVQGKPYFLSATAHELNEHDALALFIHIGRSKASWRVYQLTLSALQRQASNDTSQPTPNLQQATHIATLQDVTSSDPLIGHQQVANHEVGKLNQFIHTLSPLPAVDVFTLPAAELRKEARYQYHCEISVKGNDVVYPARLLDFSVSGLKIQVEQSADFAVNNLLSINLHGLQKVSKRHDLTDLHYRVVRKNAHNTLHLQVYNKHSFATCHSFYSMLLKKNAQHFTCIPLKTTQQATHQPLLKMADDALVNGLFFITKQGVRPHIQYSAIEMQDHPLHALFSMASEDERELNYTPLNNNHIFERLVLTPYRNNVNHQATIYIKAIQSKNKHWQFNSYLDEDFANEAEKRAFLLDSQQSAALYVLHYRLTVFKKINLQSIATDMRQLSRFAVHLSNKLEEELLAVEGMIEMTDRSAATIAALS